MRIIPKIIVLLVLFNIACCRWGVFETIRDKVGDVFSKEEEVKEPSTLDKIKNAIPHDFDMSYQKDIDEFWTGVFDALRLKKPTEIINCFGKVSGPVFFRKVRLMGSLLEHSKEGKNIRLHTDYAHLDLLMHALEHAHKCMADTNDFERMTHKLGVPNDPEYLKKAKYIYFQAKFADITDDFKVIVDHIDKKEFELAGKDFGHLFKNAMKEYQHHGEDLLAQQAFGNGLSGALGLPYPKDCLKCYNAKNAKLWLDFFRGSADSITEGRWYKADDTAKDYWDKEGKDLLEQIPDKVWKCDLNSVESKRLAEELGIDLSSKEFMEKMWDYISDHNIMYYGYLRSMKVSFDRNDYLHAGAAYGHLLQAVAKHS